MSLIYIESCWYNRELYLLIKKEKNCFSFSLYFAVIEISISIGNRILKNLQYYPVKVNFLKYIIIRNLTYVIFAVE